MRSLNTLIIAIVACVLGFAVGCKKNNAMPSAPQATPPVVNTKPVSTVSSTSIVSGGELSNATSITDEGLIWGTGSNVLTVSSANKISDGAGLSNFSDTIQNLQPNTAYYVRAYAVYSSGIAYGAAIAFTTPRTVYVAGYHGSSAAYWKDGKLFTLPNGTYAHSIFAVGNDVYIAGEDNGNTGLRAVYWKNGTPVYLTNGSNDAVAYSIFVTGNDVYVAGYELNNENANAPVAKYWKNGVAVSLTEGSLNNNGILYSIDVIGSDVYVAGFTANSYMGYQIATYWKNGSAVPLTDSTTSIASAQSIFVKDNDVYVGGNEKNQLGIGGTPVATYWKNGSPVVLTDGSQHAGITSVFVTGGDVYAAGYEYSSVTPFSIARYWKNGVPVSLTDGTKYGSAYSIYVVDGDVYVAGGEDDNFDAKCWKNGISLPLEITDQYSRSVSVFVQ